MIIAVVGALFAAPSVIKTANRVITEIVIPKLEVRALRKRRARQAAAGVPESKREVFHRVPLDVELSEQEFGQLRDMGALEILARGAKRRPHVKNIEEHNE
jgi:hypothetical protein